MAYVFENQFHDFGWAAKKGKILGQETRKMAPTRNHRPVLWENAFGTVEAANPAGKVKYFDHDWQGAMKWVNPNAYSDFRWSKPKRLSAGGRYFYGKTFSYRKYALWAK